jgi:hypothetical protein
MHHPVVSEILQQVFHFYKARESVVLCRVPDHTMLPGHDAADAAAKEAALFGVVSVPPLQGTRVCCVVSGA